ncbi:uncharacterized protein EI90DRAFT_3044256 [Cantharellus anzutake]|uniref:uncharacterized protein n=1 Tax=Cantharellus anzutake TaxID=1750568 RepID=UPI00190731B5|nr:uncharacterized protein EI90DRAFT_3044256 [Cantharellus anzutake]KAF8336941.1 hypothetical protein EI90DRAFT_3044256 [Cantharellus anzutake]
MHCMCHSYDGVGRPGAVVEAIGQFDAEGVRARGCSVNWHPAWAVKRISPPRTGGEAVVRSSYYLWSLRTRGTVGAGDSTASEKIDAQGESVSRTQQKLSCPHSGVKPDGRESGRLHLTSQKERKEEGHLTSPEKAEPWDASVSWRSADAKMPLSPCGTSGETVAWTILDLSEQEEWIWVVDLAGPEKVEARGASETVEARDLACREKAKAQGALVSWHSADASFRRENG